MKADVRIWGDKHCPVFFWGAKVADAHCANRIGYKTVPSAKRGAKRWCKRLGLTPDITVDEDCR